MCVCVGNESVCMCECASVCECVGVCECVECVVYTWLLCVFVAIHFWEAIQCLSIFVMIITDSGYNYTHWWHSCGASVPT